MPATSIEARCGTPAGANRHRDRCEPICEPCLAAAARYRFELRHQQAYPPPLDPEAAVLDLHPDDAWRKPPVGEWAQQATCADHPGDWWFPDGFHGRELAPDARAAIAICNTCPVRSDCLEHAVRVGEDEGIWGGRTPDQRRQLRRAMRKAIS